MDKEAVNEVAALARAATAASVEIEGKKYATTPLYDPRKAEATPKPILLATLTSLCEFVVAGQDGGYRDQRGSFLHVEGPTRVGLVTGIFGDFNQRVVVAQADAVVPQFAFGEYHDHESFCIQIATHFEDSTGRAAVLALVGNLSTEEVHTSSDDGISQTATARVGIVKRVEVRVPNPVALRPRRTFLEVAQPESPFILRLSGGGDDRAPKCALFEADGGAWRLEAVAKIKTFLKAEVCDWAPVYG